MAFYTMGWRFDFTGFMILALKGTDTKSIQLLFFAVKKFLLVVLVIKAWGGLL
jgi:hypothetical protein